MKTKEPFFKDILENLPENARSQPEYLKHMNRYMTNPEEYPMTESITRFNAKCTTELRINLSAEDYVQNQKVTQLEAKNLKLKLFKKLGELDSVSLGSILDHYLSEGRGAAVFPHSKISTVRERTATCPSCGKEQIIELKPLSTDKDYWECKDCGKIFSHVRDGWVD